MVYENFMVMSFGVLPIVFQRNTENLFVYSFFASKVPSSPTLTFHRPPTGPYIAIHSHDVS